MISDWLGIPMVLHQVSDWAVIAIYLPFLGMTLSSPLVAPLKNPIVSRLILFGVLDSMIESMGIDPNVAQRMEDDTLAALSN